MRKKNIFDLYNEQHKDDGKAADKMPGEVTAADVDPTPEAAPEPKQEPEQKQEETPAPEQKKEPEQEPEGGKEDGV